MSVKFLCRKIATWRDGGASDLAFLIGGADSLRNRADFLLPLGAMTLPNLPVRGMLLEQLYRAQQTLAGHPYHREKSTGNGVGSDVCHRSQGSL